MCARRAQPRQIIAWYRGIAYVFDLARCRRALVERQVDGELDSINALAREAGLSRSTASRFLCGRPASLTVTLRFLEALGLTFGEVARPVEEDDGPEGSGAAGVAPHPAPSESQPDLDTLALPRHIANTLMVNGVRTVDALRSMSDDDLLALRNLGEGALSDIRLALDRDQRRIP